MRLLYLLAAADLALCVIANGASVLGHDWFDAIFIIWGIVVFLLFALAITGFSSENIGFGFLLSSAGRTPFGFGGYNHPWVMRRLPRFAQKIVYAAWGVAAIGVLAMFAFMFFHGYGHHDVRSGGKVRVIRSAAEIRLANAWVLYGFSSAAIFWLIYPALYLFYALPDPDAE